MHKISLSAKVEFKKESKLLNHNIQSHSYQLLTKN
jgi:hypothetical protein